MSASILFCSEGVIRKFVNDSQLRKYKKRQLLGYHSELVIGRNCQTLDLHWSQCMPKSDKHWSFPDSKIQCMEMKFLSAAANISEVDNI